MSQYADTRWIKTEEDVAEYVRKGDDNVPTEPNELARIFYLVYGRSPNAEDREDGLWSLVCAGNYTLDYSAVIK